MVSWTYTYLPGAQQWAGEFPQSHIRVSGFILDQNFQFLDLTYQITFSFRDIAFFPIDTLSEI